MGKPGGSALEGELQKLAEDIDEYRGALNEVRLGARSAAKLPEKPEVLILYEQIKELGIPLVDGGLIDQPHIFMEQYAVCANRLAMWDMIDARAQAQKGLPNA